MTDEIENLVEAEDTGPLPDYIGDMARLCRMEPLSHDDVGDRCFYMNSGKVIFAILVGELADSFLVTLPSTLISTGKEVVGKLVTSAPTIRLMKSSIAFVSMPEPEHKHLYYKHIITLVHMVPGFFNDERAEVIKEVISKEIPREKMEQLAAPGRSAQPQEGDDEDEDEGPDRRWASSFMSTTRH